VGLAYHDSYITWEPNQTHAEFVEKYRGSITTSREPGEPGVFIWREYTRSALADGCFIGPHPMWRRSLHQKYGYFDGTYESAGDYEFWLRISHGEKLLHVPLVLGLYYGNRAGIELGDQNKSVRESIRAIQRHQEEDGADVRPAIRPGLVRIKVGDHYAFVELDAMRDMLEGMVVPKDPGESGSESGSGGV
jgi:hypothetical protein